MIIHETLTPDRVKSMQRFFTALRGESDLAVGLGSTLFPEEYISLPAMMVMLKANGSFSIANYDGGAWVGWAQRWVEDEDRVGVMPSYNRDDVIWVEHAPFSDQVELARKAATAEDIANVSAAIAAAEADLVTPLTPEQGLLDRRRKTPKKFFVTLLMRGEPASFRPLAWLVTDGAGRSWAYWSERAEDDRQRFNARYSWQEPGFFRWLVEQGENSRPWTLTELTETTAREPVNAVEQTRLAIMDAAGVSYIA